MPPSPTSSLSLAAKFALKPSEAAKAASPASTAAGNASPSRAKRRLSASTTTASSPVRNSPRRAIATSSTVTSLADVKGKGKQSAASTESKTASTSTSVDLQEDDGLDWEIADEDIAAISDELLVSNSKKKITLDGPAPSSSPSVAVASSSTKVPTGQAANSNKIENGNATTGKEQGVRTPIASLSSGEASEITKQFYEALSESPVAGTGGMLSHRQLLELESRTMDASWLKELRNEMKKPYFLELKRFLWTEGVKSSPEISKNIFPPADEIYSWSRFTPLDKVRVVILGQDPYHNNGQAHGLAFSVRSNVAVPPSLRNIYKEIKNDYPEFVVPKHGYLGSWAKQGVLLLNTSLSVRAHAANSHSKKGWEEFTDAILKTITKRPGPGVVFFAWGNPAQKRTASIASSSSSAFSTNKDNTADKHLILKSVHPSPLSANRGFFGNGHFRKANEWLKEKYGEDGMIDWCTIDPEEPKA